MRRFILACYENGRLDDLREFYNLDDAKKVETLYSKKDEGELDSFHSEFSDIHESEIDSFLEKIQESIEPKKYTSKSLLARSFSQIKEKAINFAIQRHSDQTYGPYPYIVHLSSVLDVAKRMGISPLNSKQDQSILLACLLHDTIEDTKTSKEELIAEFSTEVADLVDAVSLPKDLDRKEGYKVVYEKIKNYPLSALVKIADRISNLEASIEENPHKAQKYLNEMETFLKVTFGVLPKSEVGIRAAEMINIAHENCAKTVKSLEK